MAGRGIIQVGGICALCKEKYSGKVLHKCGICGLLYCGNCIIIEDSGAVCLRCAVKRVSPKNRRGKYSNISIMLAKKAKFKSEVTLSFSEIEGIICDKLPNAAYTRRDWWSNTRGRPHSEAWLTVGWAVKDVDLCGRKVTFVREWIPQTKEPKENSERRKKNPTAFKALALKRSRPEAPRKISKTRMAMLQARLKNIERAKREKRRVVGI